MIAAPTLIPFSPFGAKLGVVHSSGRMYLRPTNKNNPMIPTLIATITVFTRADSLVPMTRSQVMRATMASAGRLKTIGMGPRCGAAASARGTPARRTDTTMAGPAPTWPESPEIAVPMAAKIPAPMTAPMPSAVSCRGPRERLSPPPTSLSAMHWSTVLRRKSCALDKERRQHERDRTQKLDQHVQRRPRRVFERIADGVADHGRLVGQTALPAVFTRLDEFLGVVPRATTVVQQRRHENPCDRADHEERRHRLGADMEQQLEDQSHGDRHAHGQQSGRHHRLARPDGHDIHRPAVVGPRRPF